MSTPAAPVELRTGLPTGAGGPIGSDNAGTWSLFEQEQAFAAANTTTATTSSTTASATTPTGSS